MKTNKFLLESRFASRLALGVAAVVLGAAMNLKASVVVVSGANIDIPNNFDGVYINLETGQTGTDFSSVQGWDFNPYGRDNAVNFYFTNPDETNAGLTLDGSTYANLTLGSVIGPNGTFIDTTAFGSNANFTTGSSGYLGVEFTNAQGTTDYGYVHLGFTVGGFPATVLDYAYENTGAAITVSAVPEPSSWMLLGSGLVWLRFALRRRAAKV